MTPERIITAATITTGEKHDGKELKKLVEKSQANGIDVEAVIGDGAYSEKENIEYCEENNIKLASKLSKFVTHGNSQRNDNFEYNKDAGMYVCKAGHMAIKKFKQGCNKKNQSKVECYYFDIEKCKHCPYKEGCYKEGSKSKTYSVTIKEDIHIKHMDYMETKEFKELYAERYKIDIFIDRVIKEMNNDNLLESDFIRKRKTLVASTIFASDNIYRINSKIVSDMIRHGSVITNDYEICKNLSFDILKRIISDIEYSNIATVVVEPK